MELVNSSRFVRDAVNRIAAASVAAGGGPFRLSLCGGGTPREIYRALAEEDLDWKNFIITFGDERCGAPDHEQSNYRMIREALLDRVAIPEENVLRLKGEITPAKAADEYEKLLRQRAGDEVFRHDLLLLGMGEDGHTASLFPAAQVLEERDRWVVASEVTKLSAWRLTFTYPLINASRRVLFLVRGDSKRRIVEQIIHGGADCYPASGVRPEDGTLVWLLGQ